MVDRIPLCFTYVRSIIGPHPGVGIHYNYDTSCTTCEKGAGEGVGSVVRRSYGRIVVTCGLRVRFLALQHVKKTLSHGTTK